MKTLSLITAIEADLGAGHAAVIQLVSTGEALDGTPPGRDPDRGMERRQG